MAEVTTELGMYAFIEICDVKPDAKDFILITSFDGQVLKKLTTWAKEHEFTIGGEKALDRTLQIRPPSGYHLNLRKLVMIEAMDNLGLGYGLQYFNQLYKRNASTSNDTEQESASFNMVFKKVRDGNIESKENEVSKYPSIISTASSVTATATPNKVGRKKKGFALMDKSDHSASKPSMTSATSKTSNQSVKSSPPNSSGKKGANHGAPLGLG